MSTLRLALPLVAALAFAAPAAFARQPPAHVPGLPEVSKNVEARGAGDAANYGRTRRAWNESAGGGNPFTTSPASPVVEPTITTGGQFLVPGAGAPLTPQSQAPAAAVPAAPIAPPPAPPPPPCRPSPNKPC